MTYDEKIKELQKLEIEYENLSQLHEETQEELTRMRRYDYEIALIIYQMEERYLLREKAELEDKLNHLC